MIMAMLVILWDTVKLVLPSEATSFMRQSRVKYYIEELGL